MKELRIFAVEQLKDILAKHAAWVADSDEGGRADLRSADLSSADLRSADLRYANLILIGQDVRGFLFYGFKSDADVLVIRAGCREFVGVAAARAHWTERHTGDNVLHADCLSLVDRAEGMALVRGWKLELVEKEQS